MPGKSYCTKGCEPGMHDMSCMPAADATDPELRLLRAIFGLCPICDSMHEHEHSDEEYLDATHGISDAS